MDATGSPNTTEGSPFGRMVNVLAAPSEVFAEIKERPVEHSNWLVPAIVSLFLGIAGVLLLFSQDWAMQEIQRAQDKAMRQQVAQGKLKQEQADQAQEMMKRFMPVMVKVGGSVATTVYAFGGPFFWGFVIWLLGVKVFKADFEFMKAVEAAGLASIIFALSGLIGVLFSFAMGKLTYVSGAFFLKEFDFNSRAHFALAAINPFYIWYAAVMASAVATLSGVSYVKAAAWIFGIWILWRVALISINLGQFTM
jgi:hypothetical protein